MSDDTSDITIYHNPACSKSREALSLIRQQGHEPNVIEYLKTPPDQATLTELVAAMGIGVREIIRTNEAPYQELGLADPKWTDQELIDFMVNHPILINRPIVVTSTGARLARPVQTVLEILPVR